MCPCISTDNHSFCHGLQENPYPRTKPSHPYPTHGPATPSNIPTSSTHGHHHPPSCMSLSPPATTLSPPVLGTSLPVKPLMMVYKTSYSIDLHTGNWKRRENELHSDRDGEGKEEGQTQRWRERIALESEHRRLASN